MRSCVSGCLRVFVLGFACFCVFCSLFVKVPVCLRKHYFCKSGLECASVCMRSYCVCGCLRVILLGFACFGVFCRIFENIPLCLSKHFFLVFACV